MRRPRLDEVSTARGTDSIIVVDPESSSNRARSDQHDMIPQFKTEKSSMAYPKL